MYNRNVDVLVDSATGSSGKGQIVSKIAGDYSLLIRCGGGNAGHTVMHQGRKVCFHLLPSGSLHNPDAEIVLGPAAIIHPEHFLKEIADTGVNPKRITVDPQAVIVTQDDIDYEKEHFATMGSTCQGVGKATINKLMRTANKNTAILAKDSPLLRPFIGPALEVYERYYKSGRNVLLEGTQGSLLSVHHGKWPYVTTRDTCAAGQLSDAGIAPTRLRDVIMVVRSMPIRVKNPGTEDIGKAGGYSGPFGGKELTWEEVSARSGIPVEELKVKELTSTTKRLRRIAEFDDGDFTTACRLNGPTRLALTFADYLGDEANVQDMVARMERLAGAPVSWISRGFGTDMIEVTGR